MTRVVKLIGGRADGTVREVPDDCGEVWLYEVTAEEGVEVEVNEVSPIVPISALPPEVTRAPMLVYVVDEVDRSTFRYSRRVDPEE